MPGTHCVHYLQGRCLFEERRNPGLHRQWQCAVLKEWEEAYDTFLNQAENFQLDMDLATRIWAGRLGGMLQQPGSCHAYERRLEEDPGEQDDVLGCVHSWAGLCLLTMPRCQGMCSCFEHRQLDFGAEMP